MLLNAVKTIFLLRPPICMEGGHFNSRLVLILSGLNSETMQWLYVSYFQYFTQSWHDERRNIASGLQELNQQTELRVKPEIMSPCNEVIYILP